MCRSHAQLIHTRRLMSVRDYVDDQEKSRREEEQRAIEQRHLSGACLCYMRCPLHAVHCKAHMLDVCARGC